MRMRSYFELGFTPMPVASDYREGRYCVSIPRYKRPYIKRRSVEDRLYGIFERQMDHEVDSSTIMPCMTRQISPVRGDVRPPSDVILQSAVPFFVKRVKNEANRLDQTCHPSDPLLQSQTQRLTRNPTRGGIVRQERA